MVLAAIIDAAGMTTSTETSTASGDLGDAAAERGAGC